jgi:hypothetical protein
MRLTSGAYRVNSFLMLQVSESVRNTRMSSWHPAEKGVRGFIFHPKAFRLVPFIIRMEHVIVS